MKNEKRGGRLGFFLGRIALPMSATVIFFF